MINVELSERKKEIHIFSTYHYNIKIDIFIAQSHQIYYLIISIRLSLPLQQQYQYNFMKKSQTGVALPLITSRKPSSTMFSKQHAHSVFIQKVKHQVGEQDQYQAMQSSKISEEQKKLKQLLRQFNDQSHLILTNYISQPSKTNKSASLKNPNEEIKIAEKQLANKQKIIQQCEFELKVLQSRCDNLKYLTREDMEKQIIGFRGQILKLITENKQTGRQITLNGLNICRGEKSNEIKEMQYQKVQLEFKKTQLLSSNSQVTKQIQSIKEGVVKVQKQTNLLQIQYKEALKRESFLKELQRNKQSIKDKKKYCDSMKARNQQFISGLKQRYYIKLRQLDQFSIKMKQEQSEIMRKQQALQKSRKELIILQHKFSSLKQGVTTIKLLEHQTSKK